MGVTIKDTHGINWNKNQLEEGWEEEEDDKDPVTLMYHSIGILNDPKCLEHDNFREAKIEFRKVTVYLPCALFQKMQHLKKRKQIHSFSEAITNALTTYLD